MNEKKIYDSIIEKRKANIPSGYKELHHIVPRSLGGTNKKENLVYLSAREHYICHYLLTRIHANDKIKSAKMIKAFMMMHVESGNQNRITNSRLYEVVKSKYSEIQKEFMLTDKNPSKNTRWITDGKTSVKIRNDEPIPSGWRKGRIVKEQIPIFDEIAICKKCEAENHARKWFALFNESNSPSIREFVRNSDYNKSHVSFVKMLKKYIPEFNPEKGKKYSSVA